MNPYNRAVRKPLTPYELAKLWAFIEACTMRINAWAKEQNSLKVQTEIANLEGYNRQLKAHEFAVAVEAAKAKGLTPRGQHGAGKEYSGLGSTES